MPPLNAFAMEKLQALGAKSQRRALCETARISGAAGGVEVMRRGKTFISFSGNDYLGLSRHPAVLSAAQEALVRDGAGAGASRLVTGNHPLYADLEGRIARWKKTEAALVFGSGYLANIGVIPALVGPGDVVVADKLIHACMLDGVALSGAKLLRFAHNDMAHAEALLTKHRADYRHCLLLTETIFSMDGDLGDIAALSALAARYDAWLMSDDAHGLGLSTENTAKAEVQMGTLSKAVGGYGGYVAASRAVVDCLVSTSRSMVFSTGLPPATIAAASAALDVMMRDAALCARPLALARRFTAALGLPPAQSAIVPLIIGENDAALSAAQHLEDAGFLVAAIRPPTVPEGTARLRFTFSAAHRDAEVEALIAAVKAQEWFVQ